MGPRDSPGSEDPPPDAPPPDDSSPGTSKPTRARRFDIPDLSRLATPSARSLLATHLPLFLTMVVVAAYSFRAFLVAEFDLVLAGELIRLQGLEGFLSEAPLIALPLLASPLLVLSWRAMVRSRRRWAEGRHLRAVLRGLLYLFPTVVLFVFVILVPVLTFVSYEPWFRLEWVQVEQPDGTMLWCGGYPVTVEADRYLVMLNPSPRGLYLLDLDHVVARVTSAPYLDAGLVDSERLRPPPAEIGRGADCFVANRR